jgi:DNA repair exonuclease SbcCD ATPase subunit
MSLANEIKDAVSFLKDLETQAKDKKTELQTAANQLEQLAAALRGLASGDPSKLSVQFTQWEGVNRLLLASASAENELTRRASPDWNKIGDGVAIAAGIAVKIGIAVAGAV